MERRDVLKFTALLTGAAVGVPLATSILSGCAAGESRGGSHTSLAFFKKRELEFLRHLVDTILPESDSPSASAVGVHIKIDEMVGLVYEKAAQDLYRKKFQQLKSWLDGQSQSGVFVQADPEEHLSILQRIEANQDGDFEEIRQAYLEVKQQTVAYYLSTEIISKDYLNFLPVPGDYQPCIELSSVSGKAWAI